MLKPKYRKLSEIENVIFQNVLEKTEIEKHWIELNVKWFAISVCKKMYPTKASN